VNLRKDHYLIYFAHKTVNLVRLSLSLNLGRVLVTVVYNVAKSGRGLALSRDKSSAMGCIAKRPTRNAGGKFSLKLKTEGNTIKT